MINTRPGQIPMEHQGEADWWFRHEIANVRVYMWDEDLGREVGVGQRLIRPLDENGRPMTLEDVQERGLVDNFLRRGGEIVYAERVDTGNFRIRVLYYNYYQFLHGTAPSHIFGADVLGRDIWARLASGILVSLGLATMVFVINVTVGLIIGSIEGYYGGWTDLIIQRVKEIIGAIPIIILAQLVNLHWISRGHLSPFWGLVMIFFINGWIGPSNLTRIQFYRFKNQEYILAARTLGAKDPRIMFKHILPNAIGTIVTMTVLIIPGIIMAEGTFAFLGIVTDTGDRVALGAMMAGASAAFPRDAHILFFPAVVMSLLMISFNLFGNGLRDAFNPSLRGTE